MLPGGDQSIAVVISAGKKVAVGEATVGGFWHAFRWTAATGMVGLGTLGGPESGAFAVNGDASVIVGNGFSIRLGMDEPWRAVLPLP